MNKETITKGLALLKYTYPNTFKDYSKEDTNMMIIVWADAFSDNNPKEFEMAIKRLMKKSKYCPSIAEIKQEIALLNNPVLQLNADEAWDKAIKSIRKHGRYRQLEALEDMPDEHTREVIRQIGIERICNTDNIEWERKLFKELFTSRQDNYEDALLLSEPQRTLAEIARLAKLRGEERLLLEEEY